MATAALLRSVGRPRGLAHSTNTADTCPAAECQFVVAGPARRRPVRLLAKNTEDVIALAVEPPTGRRKGFRVRIATWRK